MNRRSESGEDRAFDALFARTLGWVAALVLGALALSSSLDLKYAQATTWPTDIYAFKRTDFGPIDVAFVGSSRTSFGVVPTLLDACVGQRLGRPVQSVNLARVFASIQTSAITAMDVLTGPHKPRVVVVEVAPETVNDWHYEKAKNIAGSINVDDIPACLSDAFDSDTLTACTRPIFRGVENLASVSAGTYRDTHHLTWMMIYQRGGQFCYGSQACQAHLLRYQAPLSPRWEKRIRTVIPTLAEDRFAEDRIGEGVADAALRELVAWGQAQGVTVAFLNLPVHGVYQQAIPPASYEHFQAYMRQLSVETGAPYYDANQVAWWGARDYFHDPDHLDADGAWQFTNELCQSMVPALLKGGR